MCGVSVDALKDCCSHIKLISNLYHVDFGPIFAPMPYSRQIGQNTEARNFQYWSVGLADRKMVHYQPSYQISFKSVRNFQYWSLLVSRGGRSKNGRRRFKLNLCCFSPIMSPHTKFHPDWMKNTEVENFHFWSILVGRTGRSKNGRSPFKHSIAVWKVINDLCTKFELNRIKIGRVSPF